MAAWTVLYVETLQAWQEWVHPTSDQRIALLEWPFEIGDSGPPDSHLPLPLAEDLDVSQIIRGADIYVTYLALAHKRRIVLRCID